MIINTTYLLILLFCIKTLGQQQQCPQGQKLSKFKNKCIQNSVCDGYMFSGEDQCLNYDPSVTPLSYGAPSISCIEPTGEGAKMVYLCSKCTDPSRPFGVNCRGCQDNEYLYTVQIPLRCVPKSYFYPYGFISEDQKAIISYCFSNQIITDGDVYGKKFCASCPQNKLVSLDQSECVDFCKPGEIKDIRPSSLRCIKWQSCKLFSSDAISCVEKCESGEYIQKISSSQKICKKCSENKPYLSLDKTECVSDCGSGNVYSEELQNCILLSDCSDFVNKGVCSKKDCTIKSVPPTKPDAVLINSPQGVKYKLCSECPESSPFAIKTNPLVCGDCSTLPDTRDSKDINKQFPFIVSVGVPFSYGDVLQLGRIKCDYQKLNPQTKIPSSIDGYLSYDEKFVYSKIYNNLGYYCPPGQTAIRNQKNQPVTQFKCSPCPNKEYNSQSPQNKCCLNGQFLHRSSLECVQECGLVASDFTCLPTGSTNEGFKISCLSDEIAKQVEYVYKDQNQKEMKKMINQCIPCNDPRLKLSDFPNLNSISWTSQQDLWKCYLIFISSQNLTQAVTIANKISGPCPPFQADQGQISWLFKSGTCVQCPADKPFLENIYEQITRDLFNVELACSRCVNKIRDYGTGMCYQQIEDISNPGAGIFSGYQRLNYWPKRLAEKSGCQNSSKAFEYKQKILQECLPVINKVCDDKNKIFDERAQKCVLPEMCSVFLSSDRKKCSIESCQPNEILVQFDKLDPSFSVKSNNGYLYQCQVCPENKPFILNGSCVAVCPANNIYILSSKVCILKEACKWVLSNSQKVCMEECGKSEFYKQIQEQPDVFKKIITYNVCYPCPKETPFVASSQNCVSQCTSQTYPNELLQCKELSTCKGVVNQTYDKSSNKNSYSCLNVCPPNLYQMPPFFGDNYNICVSECYSYYYYEQKICKSYAECKNVIFNNQCVEKCPDGLGIGIGVEKYFRNLGEEYQVKVCTKCSEKKDRSNNQYYLQDGVCKTQCSGNQVADWSTFKCIDPKICKNVISANNMLCLKECPPDQRKVYSEYLSNYECSLCPIDKPVRDYDGDGGFICREKCKILDLTSNPNKCLRLLQDCGNNKIILQDDGNYTCQSECPIIGISKIEKVCKYNDSSCYFECKRCQKNQFSSNGTCVEKCPDSYVAQTELGQCILYCDHSMNSFIYSFDEKQCFDIFQYMGTMHEKRQMIFPSKNVWLKDCPGGQIIEINTNEIVCVLKIEHCVQPLSLVNLKTCVSETNGLIKDETYSQFNNLFINDPAKCQGVVSSDGTKCSYYCKQNEIIKKDSQSNFLKCTQCTGTLQNNKDTNQPECCENGTCIPATTDTIKTINPYLSVEAKLQNDQTVQTLTISNKSQDSNNNNKQQEDSNGLSKIEIAIISVCSFAVFLGLVIGIYFISKRYKKVNQKTNDQQKYVKAAVSSSSNIKDEEIEPKCE